MPTTLHCIVVTPERAVVDQPAEFVSLPLYDGELGVLPGRAPLIGRLGTGELRIKNGNVLKRFFVDGGFVQIRSDTVTLLTQRALAAEEIDLTTAQRDLETAQTSVAKTPDERDFQYKNQVRARARIRIAERLRAEA